MKDIDSDSRSSKSRWTLWVVLAVCLLIPTTSRADLFSTEKLELFADFRARAEADWDSEDGDGDERDDRNRLRIRVRVGAQYKPNEHVSFVVRLRTGSDDSQQSPHITILDFDDNSTGDVHVNPDKWYLEGKTKHLWSWVGRNGLPFWKQNELYWDDDVTPAGLAGGFKTGLGENHGLALNAGFVSNPAGMQDFVGNMWLGQIVYSAKIGEGGLKAAVGSLTMEGEDEADFPAVALFQTGNGSRNYEIWIGSLQGKIPLGGRKLTLGADVLHNAEDYSNVDPGLPSDDPEQITFDNRDETDGHVLSILYGGGKEKGDWLAGYYYAHIETLAVNASYAQDDWVRWGSSTQTRGSNMEGHELRFVYNVARRSNLVARLYIVEAVNGPEDGNRFRLDFNHKL